MAIGLGLGVPRGVVLAWQPPQKSSLKAWWMADKGVTYDAGSAVSIWADQSGNGAHLTQTTGSQQPTYIADAGGGKPAIEFDASASQYMVKTISGQFTHVTVFGVVEYTDSLTTYSQWFCLYSASYSGHKQPLSIFPSSSNVGYVRANDGAGGYAQDTAAGVGTDTWQRWLIRSYADAKSDQLLVAIDNATGTASTGVPTLQPHSAYRVGWGTAYFAGRLREILVYDADLSQSDIQAIYDHLGSKWGL